MSAPETSRSGASADSYIGSLISLTSKSEIRYEGILYNINTEESSIGLRNVRSFGTEGRKKDGPQILPSDKIYEYILFRGSDIKDLQVKSSPPAQATSIHNDPAIIQSHYSRPPSSTSNLPSIGTGAVPDLTSHTGQLGLQRPTFQGSFPLYQPGGGLGSWGSTPPPPAANGTGLAMPPMYWQGYYAPSSGLPQLQQPPLLRPPPGLSIPHSMQQPLQFPGTNASVPSGSQNVPEFPPVPAPSLGFSLPFATPLTFNTESSGTMAQNMPSLISNKPVSIPDAALNYQTMSQTVPSIVASSSSAEVETLVPLVTPGQLLQASPSTLPSSQPLQTPLQSSQSLQPSLQPSQSLKPPLQTTLQATHKDSETKQLENKAKPLLPEPSLHVAAENKEPILPLPKPAAHKPNGDTSYTQYSNRGRGRGRGSGYSRTVTKFTEDFDFMAMNEKFKKDEVWGHLGKSKAQSKDDGELNEDEDYDDLEDDEAAQKLDKPGYVKDDFFDSLSCTSLDRGAQNGRTRFSEQLKIDTETFGDFPRHRPFRGGGRGFRGGGRGRGSYYGRGYGYNGRGRGPSFQNRAS
ncbi:protein decapping 5-like [Typha latifolia]|uniref:protein decapping 5-like n=1 Tax=Typha latifolia TaxID=4733 RepID=UPI003C2F2CF3